MLVTARGTRQTQRMTLQKNVDKARATKLLVQVTRGLITQEGCLDDP